jgi:hypothetical protein
MALAGPELAPELQRRLVEDLSGVLHHLTDGAADLAAVQAQCHVLMSLSGTVGAMALHQMADTLHMAAVDRDTTQVAALLPATLKATQTLIIHIAEVTA